MRQRRFLILSQVYVPDPASVGQHLHDFAAEMARRGHDVHVYCSGRGYDDPTARYKRRETIDGVHVSRYRLPFYNKKKMSVRILGSAWAMASLILMALFTRRVECLFYSTSPPLIGFGATIVAMLKRVPRVYWAMDLNPDQLLAMNKLKPGSLTHRTLEAMNRFVLKRATLTIALDRFMDERLHLDRRRPGLVKIIPPWPHENHVKPVSHEENWFRHKHGLDGKFVVMYSGNHGLANPLDTLLQAALRMRDDSRVHFAFIGGGRGKPGVDEFVRTNQLTNVLSLPYQPLEDLAYSLGAADLHVVSVGDDMVGIIHPCKVYGAMAVGRPSLFLGPSPSHVSDLLDAHQIGWHVAHGDVEGCLKTLQDVSQMKSVRLAEMGDRARHVLGATLSQTVLCTQLAEAVEAAIK